MNNKFERRILKDLNELEKKIIKSDKSEGKSEAINAYKKVKEIIK